MAFMEHILLFPLKFLGPLTESLVSLVNGAGNNLSCVLLPVLRLSAGHPEVESMG